MKLSMILARSVDNVIGVNGDLPWNCPADLANFKAITSRPNIALAMGRLTWASLPVRPLPNRASIVITSDPKKLSPPTRVSDPIVAVFNVENAIEHAKWLGYDELCFIGGKHIYEAVKDIVDEVHLTEMNLVVGDVEGIKTTFDHDFIHYLWPDPENADFDLIECWTCLEEGTGKELFDYKYLRRK